MSDMISEILKVMAKWNEIVEYEQHTWDRKELNIYIRVKPAKPRTTKQER